MVPQIFLKVFPANYVDQRNEYREKLIEMIAETDEFDGNTLKVERNTNEELKISPSCNINQRLNSSSYTWFLPSGTKMPIDA